MVAEIWASVISSFVDQLVALTKDYFHQDCDDSYDMPHYQSNQVKFCFRIVLYNTKQLHTIRYFATIRWWTARKPLPRIPFPKPDHCFRDNLPDSQETQQGPGSVDDL